MKTGELTGAKIPDSPCHRELGWDDEDGLSAEAEPSIETSTELARPLRAGAGIEISELQSPKALCSEETAGGDVTGRLL